MRTILPCRLAVVKVGELKHPLDQHLYAQRHLVECCFSKLKQFPPRRDPLRKDL